MERENREKERWNEKTFANYNKEVKKRVSCEKRERETIAKETVHNFDL